MTDEKLIELCPFCGGDVVQDFANAGIVWHPDHSGCPLSAQYFSRTKWNTRAAIESLSPKHPLGLTKEEQRLAYTGPPPAGVKGEDALREALEHAREVVGIYGYAGVRGRRVRQHWATELLAKIDAALTASPTPCSKAGEDA